MPATLMAVVVDCHDARRQADFWAAVLGWPKAEAKRGKFFVGDPTQPGRVMRFATVPERKHFKNRMHLDLRPEDTLDGEVARLMTMGARLIEVREEPNADGPPDTWAVLQDPEGNEFCVTSRAR